MNLSNPEGRPQVATSAVVCDGPAISICSMCEGVTTIRLIKAGWPRVRCPQCKGTGKIVNRSHTSQVCHPKGAPQMPELENKLTAPEGCAPLACSRLTGREPWLVAGLQGETIWANDSYKGDWWWPIVFVEMDTGLIIIDVCGKTQNWHLDDVVRIRINLDEVIEWEDFFNTPENQVAHE